MEIYDPNTSPIEGSFFIEASAGTGKTFSIEQIARRLVEEKRCPIEKIALVTFTKKAANELSFRTRRTLGKTLPGIFTIHGFCRHWLSELSGYEITLKSTFEEREEMIERLVEKAWLQPAEMRRLVRCFQTSEALLDAFMHLPASSPEDPYTTLQQKLTALPDLGDLFEAFCTHGPNYTKTSRRDGTLYQELVDKARLCSEDPRDLQRALDSDGIFFETFVPERLKKGKTPPEPNPFVDFHMLLPLWKEVSDPHAILQRLKHRLENPDSSALNYDALLTELNTKLEDFRVLAKMTEALHTVIIDEFQDTDPIQWSIFSKLMAAGINLIVVGDPKQSIYGFRKADIYTYFNARNQFERRYSLGTSYRASFSLTESLNALFAKRSGDFLWLPKERRTEPFTPVKSAAPCEKQIPITLLLGLVERPTLEAQRALLMPAVIEELLKLDDPSAAALLVRDRKQAALCIECLEMAGLSVRADYEIEVRDSRAYSALRAFVDQEIEENLFGLVDTDFQKEHPNFDFTKVTQIAAREGLASAFEAFVQMINGRIAQDILVELRALIQLYVEKSGPHFNWEAFEHELCQISHGIGVVVTTIHKSKGLEYDRVFALGLIQRTPARNAFVQTRPKTLATKEQLEAFEEEVDAEKLRQFYVTLTRARTHLYIPVLLAEKKPRAQTASAMELFVGYCFSQELSSAAMYSCSPKIEEIAALFGTSHQIYLKEKPLIKREQAIKYKEPLSYTCRHEVTASFSSLVEGHREEIAPAEPRRDELPVGTQTGLIVHEVIRRACITGAHRNFSMQDLERLSCGICQPTFFAQWKKELYDLIILAFEVQIGDFYLRDIPFKDLMVEVPFLYDRGDLWMKGVIDLMVHRESKLYIVDWKTNWLKTYSQESLQLAMRMHSYSMQADLYKQAVTTMHLPWSVKEVEAHYVFLRGGVTINAQNATLSPL